MRFRSSPPNIASARGANADICGALAVNRVGSAAAIAADTTVGCWCVVFGGSEMGFMVALPSSSNGGIVDGRTGGCPVRGNVLAGVSGLEDDWFVTAPQFTPDELERRIDVGRRGTPECKGRSKIRPEGGAKLGHLGGVAARA